MKIQHIFQQLFRFAAPATQHKASEAPAIGSPAERAHAISPAAPLTSVADSGRIRFGGAFLLKSRR
jgi:hypothetical protein